MDMPWSEFSKLLATKERRSSTGGSSTSSETTVDTTPENFSLGNWDSMTGYQDSEHRETI
jgi:hypothetical protein